MKQTAEEIKKISLEIQKKAADILNSGKKPYIASRVYVDYMDMIVEGFEKAMGEHASNELASYKAELREKIEREVEFLQGERKYLREKHSSDIMANLGMAYEISGLQKAKALLEDNPTEK